METRLYTVEKWLFRKKNINNTLNSSYIKWENTSKSRNQRGTKSNYQKRPLKYLGDVPRKEGLQDVSLTGKIKRVGKRGTI